MNVQGLPAVLQYDVMLDVTSIFVHKLMTQLQALTLGTPKKAETMFIVCCGATHEIDTFACSETLIYLYKSRK